MIRLQPLVARKFIPLLKPSRFKAAWGGRGGAKSHFFGEQVILKALEGNTRIVCIREVQNSIKDSVRQLLIDKIQKFELDEYFRILENEIHGPCGSLIIFRGMQSYNATNIKSLEGYDVAWVEEAQTFSQHSMDLLRPTIRKADSELWFSWNPMLKTDAVDMFFRKNPPPNATVVEVHWRDNPWFPDVLRQEMLHDFATDPDKAEHIWNGGYGHAEGAILAKWVGRAERAGRIHNGVVFDPLGDGIQISADIGFRDTAAWWYWQPVPGGFNLLMYDGDSGLEAADWTGRIQNNLALLNVPPEMLRRIWLPPDARAKTFQSKHTAMETFLSAFGPDVMRIKPASSKADQINAARTTIDRCAFHATRCESGLDGLRAWQFEYNEDLGVFSREPKHDAASHPSDGFAYGCEALAEYLPPEVPKEKPVAVPLNKNFTLDELWETAPTQSRRV